MYLFLSHLAFVDTVFSTSITPMMIIGFLKRRLALPVAGCEAQLCSVITFGTAECFLLAAMAYDRYVAICLPLLYSTHMSPRVCVLLVGASYVGGCVNAWTFTSCLLTLSFCGPNHINDFFFDQNKVLSVFYTVLIPMLNPLIYSLRNRDVKEALRKVILRIYS